MRASGNWRIVLPQRHAGYIGYALFQSDPGRRLHESGVPDRQRGQRPGVLASDRSHLVLQRFLKT